MIISKTDIQTLKDTRRRGYLLSCDDAAAAEKLLRHAGFEVSSVDDTIIEVFITGTAWTSSSRPPPDVP